MIQSLTVASAENKAKSFGFDGKFVIEPGFKFTFEENEIIYEEKSGFKDEEGNDRMSIFFAREENGKIQGLTMASLNRGTIGAGATVNAQTSKYIQGYNFSAPIVPLFNGKVCATDIVNLMKGKTIVLQAVIAYSAISAKSNKAYTGKCYVWA